ncbi:MAG: helix-turn-helix domain-containing protein [Gemmatimonadaceae bacterium]
MPRSTSPPPSTVRRTLRQLGSDLRDSRRRRRIPTAVLADRALISRSTLRRVEQGDPAVSLGVYATVFWALGLADRFVGLAAPSRDVVGLALEEERLPQRIVPRRARSPERRGKNQ